MDAIKGLGAAVLCFILFITLALLGTAVWLKATVLNQSFVAAQVNRIDVPELARTIVDDYLEIDLPPKRLLQGDRFAAQPLAQRLPGQGG